MDTIRIVALGLPGSGKTIYLSALHELIGVTPLTPGVYFPTDLQEASRLRKIYEQASDPAEQWPDRTQINEPHHESTFSCSVHSPKGIFRLFNLTFIDYAGEWLSSPDQAGSVITGFMQALTTAHALLGIIDGQQLLQYLKGNIEGYAFFSHGIRPFVERMVAFDGPIHFVITKWDLLQHDYTLAEIRKRLLDVDWFHDLIDSRAGNRRRRATGNVRLIPVSSMGNFARLSESGKMEKVPGRRPEPLNVEVPLIALLPDLSKWTLDFLNQRAAGGRDLGNDTRNEHSIEATRQDVNQAMTGVRGSGGQFGIGPFGISINLQAMVSFAVWLGEPVGKALGRTTVRFARVARRQYRRRRSKQLRRIRTSEQALFYVIRCFVDRFREFEEKYPDSLLS